MTQSDTEKDGGKMMDWYGPDAATFGDRLAAAREAAGMDQAQAARRIGVKLETLQAWEEDRTEPRANRLQMLAGLLNVSIMWLLNGEGEGLDAPGENADLPEEAAEVLAEIRRLRATMMHNCDRLGVLERRLRRSLKEDAT